MRKINNPLRTYSNGMVARLAFSVIAHTEASIILIDEILAEVTKILEKNVFPILKNLSKKEGQ